MKKKTLSAEDQELLAKKNNLEKKDYALIYDTHYKKIYSFVRSRVSTNEDAEDITSLVFERVLKKLDDFKWQGVSLTSWIYRIAKNLIIDHYRSSNKYSKNTSLEKVEDFLVSTDKNLDKILIDSEEEIKLFGTLNKFSSQDQFLVYYKFFEELSNKDIAKVMDMSESNVGTKLHRIRTKLKKIMED